MNTCFSALLSKSSAYKNDRQSISNTGVQTRKETSFLGGVHSASRFHLAVAAAVLIFVPFSSAQVKSGSDPAPAPKTGKSEMLSAIGSAPSPSPKAVPHRLSAAATTPVAGVKITAYSVDGTNSGNARLGRNVTLSASVPGQSNPSFTWSVQGAGTITSAGIYTAPTAMPANSAVTITATLASNASLNGSYSLNLVYSAPTVVWITPSTLLSGETNSVAIGGNDFTAATTITVGGTSVPAVFNGTNGVIAQVPVAAGVSSPLSIVASNPSPGGGNSAAISAAVKLPAVTLNAYSADGTNSGTARLGRNVTVNASVAGMTNPSIVWSLQGAGTINSTGTYTAPTTMPSNGAVVIKAALASNPAVSATYTLNLIYSTPTIHWVIPATLNSGLTNTVQIGGDDFTAATTIRVGGALVSTVFQAPSQVLAQIPIATGATGTVSIVASNPAPGGGSGAAVSAPIQSAAMKLTAYSVDGTNTATARLGRNVTINASVAGNASPSVTWSVQGAGTITAAGVYSAPAAMPSNGNVTIIATLASNSAVTGSYNLRLVYTAPNIRWVVPSSLVSGATNAVQFGGDDITAATTVTVNGSPVSVAFNGTNGVVAQIPIAAGSTSAVTVVASNPAPGGGNSAAVSATVKPLSIALSSFSTAGVNPTTASIGQSVQFSAVVSGGNPALSWPVSWSLQGAGTISSTGLYQSPSAMPSSAGVIVTATLASNALVTASSSFSLLNSSPVVNQSQPVQATAGITNTITFFGSNFNAATTIQVNGQSMPTTYISPTSISAAIAVPQNVTTALAITAVNPAATGGQSSVFSLPIGDSSTVQAIIGSTPGFKVAGDFVGFSHEWGESQAFMGTAKNGVNNIYRQLVKNLTNPGTPFFIRIGGSTTDKSVEPTATTVTAFADLANAMPVHFSMGINLGSNSLQLSEDQAANFTANMPAGSLVALELGNEADNYSNSHQRASTYDFNGYLADFNTWSAGIAPLVPSGMKYMGPSFTTIWKLEQNLPALEQAESSQISLISAHFYAGYVENVSGVSTQFAPDYLLQPTTTTKSIPGLAIIAASAHKNGELFRIGEMNSIDDSGVQGISNSFSSALWAVDQMFEQANVGVDGVNFHGMSGCNYCAFTFGTQNATGMNTFRLQQVNPLYYGLLFFHQATANSATLLPVTVSAGSNASPSPNVKVWATVDASGTVHVAIINKDETFAGDVQVSLPGYGQATAIRMVAPNYKSEAGITLGGQTFDNSFDGNPIGSPMTESFVPTNSVYSIPVQPTSAVLLTLTK